MLHSRHLKQVVEVQTSNGSPDLLIVGSALLDWVLIHGKFWVLIYYHKDAGVGIRQTTFFSHIRSLPRTMFGPLSLSLMLHI
jgi:hypothetical protein